MDTLFNPAGAPDANDTGEGGSMYSYKGPDGEKKVTTVAPWGSFLEEYCYRVAAEEQLSWVAEKVGDVAPLVIDIGFQLKKPETQNADTSLCHRNHEMFSFLEGIAKVVQDCIRDLAEVSIDIAELICVALEVPDTSTVWSSRLYFPYCCVSSELAGSIYEMAVGNLYAVPIPSLLREEVWDDAISMPRESISMYGATTEVGVYRVLTYWKYHGVQSSLEETFEPMNHRAMRQRYLTEDTIRSYDLEHWLPLFLSSDFYTFPLTPRRPSVVEIPAAQTRQEHDPNPWREHQALPDPSTFDTGGYYEKNLWNEGSAGMSRADAARDLLPFIKAERHVKYNTWTEIGKALHWLDKQRETGLEESVGLDMWIEFTEKAVRSYGMPGFLDGDVRRTCAGRYDSFSNSSFTIKTLAWYARRDSPDEYKKWHDKWCHGALIRSVSCDDCDIAAAMYRLYWLEFCCCYVGDKITWYKFCGHRWERDVGCDALRLKVAFDMSARYDALKVSLSEDANGDDPDVRKDAEDKIRSIQSTVRKLRNKGSRYSVIGDAEPHFSDRNFVRNLDNNLMLTGVDNGVLEASNQGIFFREGKPEDYIRLYTSTPYKKFLTMDDHYVKAVLKWVRQMFVDEDLVSYIWKFNASILRGGNIDKILPALTGPTGDNSKTSYVKLLEETYHDLCFKMPESQFTERAPSSTSATPFIDACEHTKLIIVDEMGDDVLMKKSFAKRITGNDTQVKRGLYQGATKAKASAKVIIVCNNPPGVLNPDGAIENRFKVWPCDSKWKKDAPEDEDEQMSRRVFKADPHFDEKIPDMAPAFLWLSVEYFDKYLLEGLDPPDAVKKSTDNYWNETDSYRQFANEMLVKHWDDGSPDPAYKVTLDQLYKAFVQWYAMRAPGRRPADRNILKTQLDIRMWHNVDSVWNGITIVTHDRQEESGYVYGRGNMSAGVSSLLTGYS